MLIGLYGPSRAGKDTVAGVLVKDHDFEQRNLASPIRETLLKMDPMVQDESGAHIFFTLSSQVEEFGWDTVKAWYPESVSWMIALGQAMRDIDENIWLNACVGRPYDNLVIADVRQPNEYEYIVKNGGEVWKVEREGTKTLGMDGLLEGKEFTETINNNGTIMELGLIVKVIMGKRKWIQR